MKPIMALLSLVAIGASPPPEFATIASAARAELARAWKDFATADARSRAAEAQMGKANGNVARLRAQAIVLAARIQGSEATIDAMQARLALIAQARTQVRERMAQAQGGTMRLTGALQSMTRQPALLTIVQPTSVSEAVHLRAALDGAMPRFRAQTADVRRDLSRLSALQTASASILSQQRVRNVALVDQRAALDRLAVGQLRAAAASAALTDAEQNEAALLGEQARDLATLVGRIDGAAVGAGGGPGYANWVGNARYLLPTRGVIVTGFGDRAIGGTRSRGLTIATTGSAQVVAPAAGRIAFAGPFRDYGNVVIIDHGRGWMSVLTGLDRLAVGTGQAVESGSPLARATRDGKPITVELRRRGQPVDIARLVG